MAAATAGLHHSHHQIQHQIHQQANRMNNFMSEEHGKSGNFPQQQQQQQQWIPDERDAFISWLRSEFAAANAIIDAMCAHLTSISNGPGEYDLVLNCLRQRRFNWSSILHMQQYFSVEEVVLALQQVAQIKRRQMQVVPRTIGSAELGLWPDRARSASSNSNNSNNSSSEPSSSKKNPNSEDLNGKLDHHTKEDLHQMSSSHEEHDSGANQVPDDRHHKSGDEDENNRSAVKIKQPKCFQSQEIIDGRMINVVEGLKVWEVFNALECDHITSLMSDLDGVGRKIEIGGRGHKIIGGKRFLKAKGGEHNPDDDRSSPEDVTESLPGSLEVIANRLLDCQILSKRPDSFIVSFLGEEGYLLPQIHNQEFEHPYCIVFLQSECSMVIGRFINMDSPGEFRSQFKLSVQTGTVVSLQGNAAKIARYAIPALPTKRCCVVLGKMLAKRGGASRNSGGGGGFGGGQRSSAGIITRPASSPNFNNMQVHQGSPNASSMQHGFPPPQGGPYPPMPLVVPNWSPVPRPPRVMTGTGVFLPYNASSGPGRPGSANRCRQPFLQKTNSLPASFRTQNGLSSSSSTSSSSSSPVCKAAVEEDSSGGGHSTHEEVGQEGAASSSSSLEESAAAAA